METNYHKTSVEFDKRNCKDNLRSKIPIIGFKKINNPTQDRRITLNLINFLSSFRNANR